MPPFSPQRAQADPSAKRSKNGKGVAEAPPGPRLGGEGGDERWVKHGEGLEMDSRWVKFFFFRQGFCVSKGWLDMAMEHPPFPILFEWKIHLQKVNFPLAC